MELRLAPHPLAPSQARAACEHLVFDFAGDSGFRARLAISELVANCVRHAQLGQDETFVVRLTRSAVGLRVEVEQPRGVAPAALTTLPPPDAISGRGLAIVEAVVDRSGVRRASDGGYVWFEVDRPITSDETGPTTSSVAAQPAALLVTPEP